MRYHNIAPLHPCSVSRNFLKTKPNLSREISTNLKKASTSVKSVNKMKAIHDCNLINPKR